MSPRQPYSASIVWRRRECTWFVAFNIDLPPVIIHVGCVMLSTSRREIWAPRWMKRKEIEETREGHFFCQVSWVTLFFFLVCLARLAEGEATAFPSTCFRERWENGERTEISVTVTKGVACEKGYASTCLVDFLYNFVYFSFWEEGMMLQSKLCVCTSLSSEPPILKNLFY